MAGVIWGLFDFKMVLFDTDLSPGLLMKFIADVPKFIIIFCLVSNI